LDIGYWIKRSVLFLFLVGCQSDYSLDRNSSLVNPAHLDHLYEQIEVSGKKMAIIHIYSDHPDYKWAWESHEGVACVDDVARAAIFYAKYYEETSNQSYIKKIIYLTEFLLYMQADNGYFFNFVLEDFAINKTYKRSVPIDNWWSWRALWALTDIYPLLQSINSDLAGRMWDSISKTVKTVIQDYNKPEDFRMVAGFRIPTWLPSAGGSDQGATLVLGLLNYYRQQEDQRVLSLIEKLCDGICIMQAGDSLTFPYGAILSWENNWHAWGCVQSFVLLKAYQVIKKEDYLSAGLLELDHFYEYLIQEKYISELKLKNEVNQIITLDLKKAPQIAYGIRPMIYACLEAHQITGETHYMEKAVEIAKWFFGDNFADAVMYHPESGICYDGINEDRTINLNSGAESTIEALLALLAIEQNPHSRDTLLKDNLKN
jgi:hypothetical protein